MSTTTTPGTHTKPGPTHRGPILALSSLTALGAAVGVVQLVTGTYTPPVSDLEPLGLHSWVLPGVWLAVSVAVPCTVTAVLAVRRSPLLGRAAVLASALLLVELLVQIPFVGLDPLQAVLGAIAVTLGLLGLRSGHPE
jgi:hypothetical protein